MGTAAFVRAHAAERRAKEELFLAEIPLLPDPQCAWVLLSQSAVARAAHTLRTVPPQLAREYAAAHDNAVWRTFCELLGT